MQCQQGLGTTIIDRIRLRHQRPFLVFIPYLVFPAGGSSSIHGQIDIVLTLPLLFLITVIFIRDPLPDKNWRIERPIAG